MVIFPRKGPVERPVRADTEDYEEELALATILAELPEDKPECPLCGDKEGLTLHPIRYLKTSLEGYTYDLVVRLQCKVCKKYLERDATEEEIDQMSFEAGH